MNTYLLIYLISIPVASICLNVYSIRVRNDWESYNLATLLTMTFLGVVWPICLIGIVLIDSKFGNWCENITVIKPRNKD